MRIITTCLLLFSSFFISIHAQNIELVGQLPYSISAVNDVWGYTAPNGHEFAIVGLEAGTSIVDISTDPSNPTELHFIPGAFSTWRDIKVWGEYAYVTHDHTDDDPDGLLIIDLGNILSINNDITYSYWTGPNNFQTAHNIYIDENGYAYLFGSNIGIGGALILDLNVSPDNPTVAGMYDTRYIHDAYVRDNIMWTAEVYDGLFSVVDVTNKSNPIVLATQSTPDNFTHNTWLSDDGNYLFTTDEVNGAFLGMYDVSDINNISEVNRFQSKHSQNPAPHNTFVHGDYLVTSYYKDGVLIHDISNPNIPVEIGHYDTSPLSGGGFEGCWGVYPYFNSGLLLASDRQEGLFVLSPTYQQACYLTGIIRDADDSSRLFNAYVEVLSTNSNDFSDLMGEYKTGAVDAGGYSVQVSAAGYYTKTIDDVALVNGETTTLDVELDLQVPFSTNFIVVDAETQAPIEGASVHIVSDFYEHSGTTNFNGLTTFGNFYRDNYVLTAGKWGYITNCIHDYSIDENSGTVIIELSSGYCDEFTFDFGWTVQGDASRGIWERGEPIGTNFEGILANPNLDISSDCSGLCYVTGNGGGSAGADDVDNGQTILTSPSFTYEGITEPTLAFYYWFVNTGGNGPEPDDTFTVSLTDGNTAIQLLSVTESNSEWKHFTYDLNTSPFDPTSSLQVVFETGDQPNSGHIVEAAIDGFKVTDNDNVFISIEDESKDLREIHIYPNPAKNFVLVHAPEKLNAPSIQIFDIYGRKVLQQHFIESEEEFVIDISDIATGHYLLKATDAKQAAVHVQHVLILRD